MKRAASAKSVSEVSRKSICAVVSSLEIDQRATTTEESAAAASVGAKSDPSALNNGRSAIATADPTTIGGSASSPTHLNGTFGDTSAFTRAAMEQDIAEKVAILDFGAQYGKVIDRRVRECNVYSETLPLSTTAKEIVEKKFDAIIISGGPKSVYAPDAPKYDPEIFNLGIPILGICYGFQVINKHFGGQVSALPFRADGQTRIHIRPDCPLFSDLESEELVLLTHGDSVTPTTVAPDFEVVAQTEQIVAAIANVPKRIYGCQFHPEVDLTENGHKIFNNFLRKIAGLHATYTIQNRKELCISYIQESVGDKKVLVLVSGGVDSTVCAALLNEALGRERVIAIHIDNGFMRYNESKDVKKALEALGLKVNSFECTDDFLNARLHVGETESLPLKQVVNPEEKRMIIGDTFMRCKDFALRKLGLDIDMFIAQGTLRPDLIESASNLASGAADTIKTHHNDTALVRELRNLGKVVEPLKDFHKDEVRELGRQLGLPETIVNRHPFPGPGLAIRILCAEKPYICEDFVDVSKRVVEVTQQFCGQFCKDVNISATLLPIRSVGVQGDKRSYAYAVALSTDHRPIPWEHLDRLSNYIPSVVSHVNRVCYVFGPAVSHQIRDITVTHLTEGTIAKLRRVDRIVTQVLNGLDANDELIPDAQSSMHLIQQMPVVLIPIQFNQMQQVKLTHGTFIHSIVLRPFITRDFMTGKNALPGRDIPEGVIELMVNRIMAETPYLSRVLIDLTSKPPGTTEWE